MPQETQVSDGGDYIRGVTSLSNSKLNPYNLGLSGDPPAVVMPRLPDTTLMPVVDGYAYVAIDVLNQAPASQANLPFDRNIREQEVAYSLIGGSKNVDSSQAYWAAHVVSAFQGHLGGGR